MALLEVRDLSFSYAAFPDRTILGHVSFSVDRGEFVTVCGATGSGKSTLIRLLKRELQPLGNLSGSILINGQDINSLPVRTTAALCGYVCQRPEQQIVTDKVWHELAFGLENLGLPQETIRRRTAEMAAYFGIEEWFDRRTDELSGGQKQLLNLASVMVMQPEMLLLDEPTAQLDPIAASSFISTVKRLNQDFSLTVIIIEHRLEEVIPLSNRIISLDKGRLFTNANVRDAVRALSANPDICGALPCASRLFSLLSASGDCPVSVREGNCFIKHYSGNEIKKLNHAAAQPGSRTALEFRDVYFRYERNLDDVLRGLSFRVYEGDLFFLLGGNGSGKSTALSACAGLIKPYSGTIKVFERRLKEYKNQTLYINCVTLLPQDVQTVFLAATVREELKNVDISGLPFDISGFMDMHPYDLSGGQQQLVALAKALATKPRLLLLDEPTKGLDSGAKQQFISILRQLKADGVTVVCVTHDAEFAAETADRCALFFRGEVISVSDARSFFSGNAFYTTAANRIARGYYEGISTTEELAEICRMNRQHDSNQ